MKKHLYQSVWCMVTNRLFNLLPDAEETANSSAFVSQKISYSCVRGVHLVPRRVLQKFATCLESLPDL
jgi:hypothetical protein